MDGMTTACRRDPQAEVEILRDQNERLKAAILDIDAHATGLGGDEDGFITGGYIVSVGSLHRALGIIGHTAVKCRTCGPESHDCTGGSNGAS